MHVILSFTLVPIDAGASLSRYVAETERILDRHGLTHHLHANGTNVEGEWEAVFAAIRECHEVIHDMGAGRIFTTVQLGTRTDRAQRMDDKVASVRRHLGGDDGGGG